MANEIDPLITNSTNDTRQRANNHAIGYSEFPRCQEREAPVPIVNMKVYKKRWYMLAMFSLVTFMQSEQVNSWTVIDESAEVAFGWTKQQISLMQIWIYSTFIASLFPFLWLMDKIGLRVPVLICAGLSMTGALLRCISDEPPYVTWFANAAHIAIGLAGPVAFTVSPVLSSLWFPPNQRATATAIAMISGFAGAAGCFALGPSVVEQPKINTTMMHHHEIRNYTNIGNIKREIMYIRYGECLVTALVFLAILTYFPSKPKLPPSISASLEKLHFRQSLKNLFGRGSGNFWLICLPYTISTSIYGIWSALFNINLKSLGVSEQEAGWLGFWAVAVGCLAAIIIGRIADVLVGHMKMMVLILVAGNVLSTFVFLLIANGFMPCTTLSLYATCIIQGFFLNGAIPLYFELAMESTYPITETMTSGVMNLTYNIVPLFFVLVFLIPNVGLGWMNWVMFGSIAASFPMVLAFKERYNRLNVDQHSEVKVASNNKVLSVQIPPDTEPLLSSTSS